MKAKESLGRSLAADPNEIPVLLFYARVLGRNGDFAGKAEGLERILKANPWFNAGDVELLDALARSGALARAFELYDRYLQFHPQSVDALLLLGDMKRRQKAPNSEAAEFYRKAAAADGARPEPHRALARLAMAEESYASAAQHARAAAIRNPSNPSAHLLEAVCLELAGDRSAARIAAEKALALAPTNAEAQQMLRRLETSGSRKR